MDSKRARFAIFLTVFVDLLGFGIVIPILPLYAKGIADHPSPWMEAVNGALHLQHPGAFWAGMAFVAFSVMQFFAAPFLGRISDRTGRRPVLWVSLLGAAASYLLMAVTDRYEWVLAARILGGLLGANIPVAQAAMADTSTPEERSKVLGMVGAAFGLGFVLGPALAGLLSGSALGVRIYASHGWHLPFFVAAALSLLASLLVLVWVPETLPPDVRERSKGGESRGHALKVALGRPGMPQVLGISLLAMTGFAIMEGTFALLANARFGFRQREVGYLFGAVGILMVIYQGGLVRIVARRVPERVALWTGLAMMGLSLPLLPVAPWAAPFLLTFIPLSWGSGMGTTAAQALASQLTPPEDQGSLFGVLNAVAGVGRILGPLAGTFTFARWGTHAPYWLAAGCLGVGLALALSLPRVEARGSHPAA
ncbi:MAG: MFS transporter [Acidobacteria bacterium]|nr:MFS transporter [Acidobacteriota bacterium]